ncbi:hypothetical protein Tco_0813826 [Tanacetum coccineum]
MESHYTSEYGISKDLHLELPAPGDRIVDFIEDKIDEKVFPTIVDWPKSAPKDEKPVEGSYSVEDIARLDTRRSPIQKQSESLICLVGLSQRYYLGDDVYPTFLYDDGWEMDLFNLISAPNPAKVKIGTRPRATHEVPLLTVTTNRVIDMREPVGTTESSGIPSTIERSSLDFDNENPSQQINKGDGTEDQFLEIGASEVPPTGHASTTGVVPNIVIWEEGATDVPLVSKRRYKRVNDGADANAPPKVLRKYFDVSHPTPNTFGGKSFASTGLEAGSTLSAPASHGTPAGTIDTDLLSFAEPQPAPARDIAESSKGATIAGDPDSEESSSFTSFVGSLGGIYQPGWGITNNCHFDTPGACQDAVDHMVPLGYFSELRHSPNKEFLNQYNVNLARQVAMGSQLQLRFEQEVRLLKKAKEKESRDPTGGRDLQVNNNQLFHQVSTLEAQVTGEEQIKAAFEEFKKREEDKVEQRCAEIDARLDALSIDFDEELYPHILTAIAGRRWVIGHGLHLAVMKCAEFTDLRQAFANVVSAGIAKGMSEGLKYGVEHGKAQLDLEVIEAYDPEADAKYVAALHALKDLEYPLIDHLEKLKDAPIDLIMVSLHLESDVGEETPHWIRELRLSSSQLKVPVYSEVRDPRDLWAFKEEMLLEDAITANVSRAKKKKKCRVVCRTHGIGSAHHPRSNGIPVSVPTVAPQGLAILLTDASTRTETTEDEASPRLIRSKSLPPMYNLDWP